MKRVINFALTYFFIFVTLCLFYLIIFGQGLLVRKERVIKVLEGKGFSDIVIIKRQWSFIKKRGGSDEDDVRFTTVAIDPSGKKDTFYVFVEWPNGSITIKPRG